MHHKTGIAITGLLGALFIASCGNSSPGTTKISFRSAAVKANGKIRASVSCGAGSLWLPLEWGPTPRDTKELAIYIGLFSYKNVKGIKRLEVSFGEIISGVKPTLRRNRADTLPEGVTWSKFGESCPQDKRGLRVLQELFAFDRAQASRKMDRHLATRLTEEALRNEGIDPDSRSPGPLTEDAVGIGRFTAVYGAAVH
jgi:hypothetical protein